MQTKMKLNGGRWGGIREGAGRRRMKSIGVAHQIREKVTERTPLHVNFKYRIHVRNKDTLKLLKKAIHNARTHGLKIRHYSFQSNHVHLIIQASSNEILTKGMRSLTITLAKGIQRGSIQLDRYHLHVLRTVKEARNAVQYVLFNQQRHEKGIYTQIDENSSLLGIEKSFELIKKFAVKKRMTIRIQKGDTWVPETSTSYILKRAEALLFS